MNPMRALARFRRRWALSKDVVVNVLNQPCPTCGNSTYPKGVIVDRYCVQMWVTESIATAGNDAMVHLIARPLAHAITLAHRRRLREDAANRAASAGADDKD